ncbi:SprT-like domain-containing protein [Bacillus tropicus]|uniref:SprT-like domain-containing protein n=1 Tax=Bacillus cereus group TaxID=86661 RepID=UPI0021CEDE79|nr:MULTISPECIES: SprT-like domain-containing protein [Bacillus cereus group]MCU5425783.1 SprT-like domain-containing protein [Bacillus tropicus]MDA1898894.1 SprT-like domain-containing protein [Bacillus cereus group sp. BcHK28]
MSNIQFAIDELHVAFKKLNTAFFEGDLPEPAITIQSSRKRRAMGWCSSKEVWSDKDGTIKKYELNISAEYLDHDFMETMDTMLHEMVHLYNAVNGIQDTSRNGTYHNKRFKSECEKRGFFFPESKPDKKYGWYLPRLTDDAKEKILQLEIKQEAFGIARRGFIPDESVESEGELEEAVESRPSSFKWICPKCNLIVRSTKDDIFIICGECEERMIQEEKTLEEGDTMNEDI